jgi:4-diphosphocytidyl-2-C-methyl-D-erythritol kinase
MNPTALLPEAAYAKLNLVLHVGRPRADGLHPLCSLFASLDLADEVTLQAAGEPGPDWIDCPGVEGPNLALAALAALRHRLGPDLLPAVRVSIAKRVPVAAGLGGGSADAAAVLRLANRLAGEPLPPSELRKLAVGLGSDVPSQVEPIHALVQGAGELVEPLELPPLGVVLVPGTEGLSTRAVYAELDRRGGGRKRLDPEPLRRLAEGGAEALTEGLENDLQPAALALRPELAATLDRIRAAGARGAAVSGSGPTCFGLFADRLEAERAALTPGLRGALVSELRAG